MKNLTGKNVIITGAGSGIGRIMARLFAAEGAQLALVDISGDALDSVKREITSGGGTAETWTCDISDREMVGATAEKIRARFSRIDVLVNNAGIVVGKKFIDLSLDEIERTMSVNFFGHIYFTKAFINDMIGRDDGVIVNVASSGGLLGMTGLSDYCASKFAEVGISESLRRELKLAGARGVTVTCVCPYIIDTGMFKGFTAFRLNPFIKPEKAAKKIVAAVKKRKPYVRMPALSVYGMTVLKVFLPTRLFDWILGLAGGYRAMETFEGRVSVEESHA